MLPKGQMNKQKQEENFNLILVMKLESSVGIVKTVIHLEVVLPL